MNHNYELYADKIADILMLDHDKVRHEMDALQTLGMDSIVQDFIGLTIAYTKKQEEVTKTINHYEYIIKQAKIMENEKGNAHLTLFRIGDDIDNRGGVIIKNIEHYHAGEDAFLKDTKIDVPAADIITQEVQPQIEPLDAEDRIMSKLNAPVITPLDRIYAGIRYVRESGIVKHDYEYAAIKYRIDSFRLFEKLSNSAFVEMLMASGAFTEEDCPTAGNLKKVQIDGEYPNWRLIGKGCDSLSQLFNVAKKFDEGCKNIG